MVLLLPNLELESRGNIIKTIARINLPESYVALSNLLKQLDGFSAEMETGPRSLHTANASIHELGMDFGEQILA